MSAKLAYFIYNYGAELHEHRLILPNRAASVEAANIVL